MFTREVGRQEAREGRWGGIGALIVLALVVATTSWSWVVIPYTFILRHDEQNGRANIRVATSVISNLLFIWIECRRRLIVSDISVNSALFSRKDYGLFFSSIFTILVIRTSQSECSKDCHVSALSFSFTFIYFIVQHSLLLLPLPLPLLLLLLRSLLLS